MGSVYICSPFLSWLSFFTPEGTGFTIRGNWEMGEECLARVQWNNSDHFWQDHKWPSTFHLSLATSLCSACPRGTHCPLLKISTILLEDKRQRQLDRGQFLKNIVALQLFNVLCDFLSLFTHKNYRLFGTAMLDMKPIDFTKKKKKKKKNQMHTIFPLAKT